MQIAPLNPGSLQPERASIAGAAPSAVTRLAMPEPAAPAAPPPAARALPRPGLQVLQDARNTRVAGAQQALDYLDRLGSGLRQLRAELASAIAGHPVAAERLEAQRQSLTQLWDQRLDLSGGRLDSQLRYVTDGVPMQGFTVRGLDAGAAAPTSQETLTIAIGLPTPLRPAARVLLAPDTPAPMQARRFDYALAPLGLRAQPAPMGGLRLEVAEARWPQVREQLAIQGEGRRFPAGRLHRVQTDAEPAAITPQALVPGGGLAGRAALQQLSEALARTETARRAAQGVLAQDRSALAGEPAAQDAGWAQDFSAGFGAAMQDQAQWREGSYGVRAALGAAVGGVARQRVDTLLA